MCAQNWKIMHLHSYFFEKPEYLFPINGFFLHLLVFISIYTAYDCFHPLVIYYHVCFTSGIWSYDYLMFVSLCVLYIPYNKHALWILKYYNFNRISFCKLLHSFTYNAQSIQQNIVTCNHNLSNKWGMVSKWFYVHVI